MAILPSPSRPAPPFGSFVCLSFYSRLSRASTYSPHPSSGDQGHADEKNCEQVAWPEEEATRGARHHLFPGGPPEFPGQ